MGNKVLGFKFRKDASEHIPEKWRLCLETLKASSSKPYCTMDELISGMGYKNGIADRKSAQVAIYKLKSKGCLTSICEKVETSVTKQRRLFVEQSRAMIDWMNRLNSDESKEKFLPLFLKYFEWVKANGYYKTPDEMIEHLGVIATTQQQKFTHINMVEDYLRTSKLSVGGKRSTYTAVRSFYRHNKTELPRWTIKITNTGVLKPKTPQEPVTLDELHQLLKNASPREQAIFTISLQAGLDRSTFARVFNLFAWEQISKQLGSDHEGWDLTKAPIRINLVRIKTQEEYYSFLSTDALKSLQAWLNIRYTMTNKPIQAGEPIFITRQRTPIRKESLSYMFNNLAIRAGLEKKKYGKASDVRYRFHEHELRDTFKSACTAHGVNYIVSEFFIGHNIDKLGYDKSPSVYPEVYRKEYQKVEPYLNVISKQEEKVDALQATILKQSQLIKNYDKRLKKSTEINDKSLALLKNYDVIIRMSGKVFSGQKLTAEDKKNLAHVVKKVNGEKKVRAKKTQETD